MKTLMYEQIKFVVSFVFSLGYALYLGMSHYIEKKGILRNVSRRGSSVEIQWSYCEDILKHSASIDC